MFAGLGVGAWVAAIFHLMTHAFFKGLLFLGSGSVIHGMHHAGVHGTVESQDIRNMGQLRKQHAHHLLDLPDGSLANAGLSRSRASGPKTRSSAAPFQRGNWLVGALLMAAAFLTALYMFRLVFVSVLRQGQCARRGRQSAGRRARRAHYAAHPIPLVILAIPAAIIGFVGVPPDMGWIHDFLSPVFASAMEHGKEIEARTSASEPSHDTRYLDDGCHRRHLRRLARLLPGRPLPAAYQAICPGCTMPCCANGTSTSFIREYIVDGGKALAYGLWRFDQRVIDGTVNGVAGLMANWGRQAAPPPNRLRTGLRPGDRRRPARPGDVPVHYLA